MANGAKVLVYNIDFSNPRGEKLRNIVRICGAVCQSLCGKDSCQTLGYLLGLDGFGECLKLEEPVAGEALIFYHFTKQELDRILAALKRAGIFIPLKAVVTEHNVNWTVARLLAELEQEHRLMTAWQKLSACVKKYKGTDKTLVKEAKAMLAAHAPEEEALMGMIARFEKHE